MSPKPADPKVRVALIEAAADLIASEGPASLTLRRLAKEVGTSTMAVYTHFGGMDELRRELRREGFARLREHLAAVPVTDDPMADLAQLGAGYYMNAVANPNLYRAMFMEGPLGAEDADVGIDTFMTLVEGVQRCIDAGELAGGEAFGIARQLWVVAHGAVTLQLAHLLTPQEAQDCFRDGAMSVLRAFDPASARQ